MTLTDDEIEQELCRRARAEESESWTRLVLWAQQFGPTVMGRNVVDVVFEQFDMLKAENRQLKAEADRLRRLMAR